MRRCHAALPNWTLILKFSLTVMSTRSTEVKLGGRGEALQAPSPRRRVGETESHRTPATHWSHEHHRA
ncbi:protein of unknown function [Blastococcus saxobsidens DD2]|uniref:Uncharacterized protein n=1 Tax=Blastococcus saxobsidens (strain DD2) TaxID=1146883 RepID=H6RTS0_BLASD|nr:protein of unknown function [Blastococcus saxobsidens DD2]